MATVEEIEHAIRELSPPERRRLAESLPNLIPELDGDARWSAIAEPPRPALAMALNALDAEYAKSPGQFPVMTTEDFDEAK